MTDHMIRGQDRVPEETAFVSTSLSSLLVGGGKLVLLFPQLLAHCRLRSQAL